MTWSSCDDHGSGTGTATIRDPPYQVGLNAILPERGTPKTRSVIKFNLRDFAKYFFLSRNYRNGPRRYVFWAISSWHNSHWSWARTLQYMTDKSALRWHGIHFSTSLVDFCCSFSFADIRLPGMPGLIRFWMTRGVCPYRGILPALGRYTIFSFPGWFWLLFSLAEIPLPGML